MQDQMSVDFVADRVEQSFSNFQPIDSDQPSKLNCLANSMEELTVHMRSMLRVREELLASGFTEDQILDLQLSVTNAVGFHYCKAGRGNTGPIGDFLGLDIQTDNVVRMPQLVS